MNEYLTSRRSRIFIRGRPLSCEVPSRRDSVGGGSSRIFPWSPKTDATLFSGGGSARNFPLMGPFYIFSLSRRGGGPGPLPPPLNRPLLTIDGGGNVSELSSCVCVAWLECFPEQRSRVGAEMKSKTL